jgi:hypothetical protein
MKYGDELDRIPSAGFSRRQFLTAGSSRAARLAAGVLLPGGAKRLMDTPTDAVNAGDSEEQPDRRDS